MLAPWRLSVTASFIDRPTPDGNEIPSNAAVIDTVASAGATAPRCVRHAHADLLVSPTTLSFVANPHEARPLLEKDTDPVRITSIGSAVSSGSAADSAIGIQAGQSVCQGELHCEVFAMQRATFAISAAAHLAAAVLFAAEAWANRPMLETMGRKDKQLPGLAQLIWPFFYTASLVLLCAGRFAGRTASSSLQGFQLGAAMAVRHRRPCCLEPSPLHFSAPSSALLLGTPPLAFLGSMPPHTQRVACSQQLPV